MLATLDLPPQEDYDAVPPLLAQEMLRHAQGRVETTWRASESIDAKASAALTLAGTLSAGALGALAVAYSAGRPILALGAFAALFLLLCGTMLAAFASLPHDFKPPFFPGSAFTKDVKRGLKRRQILSELARAYDEIEEINAQHLQRRTFLLFASALSIPVAFAFALFVLILA